MCLLQSESDYWLETCFRKPISDICATEKMYFDITGTGKIDFESFAEVVGTFLVEEDDEAMQKELKEAFRLYDKEGEILANILKSLTNVCFRNKLG